MKCDKLKPIELECNMGKDINGVEHREPWKAYDIDEVDAAIEELKDKCQMHDFFWEGCGFAKRGFKNTIAVSEAFDKLEAENAELKQKLDKAIAERDGNQVCIDALKKKLEDVQASMYCDVVDVNMENRRLKRALFMAHSIKANFHWWWAYECLRLEKQMDEPRQWMIDRLTATQEACKNSRKKCRAMAEKFK